MGRRIAAIAVALCVTVGIVAAAEMAVIKQAHVVLNEDGTWSLLKDIRATGRGGVKIGLHKDGTWEEIAARGSGAEPQNLSQGKTAQQSSVYGHLGTCVPAGAVDGDLETGNQTDATGTQWWEVDLGQQFKVDHIVLYPFPHAPDGIQGARILLSKKPFPDGPVPSPASKKIKEWKVKTVKERTRISLEGKTGRYLRIQQQSGWVGMLEVEVMGN